MRWVTFTFLFLLLIFTSFWVYVWSWKKELIQNTVTQACPPLKCIVESVEFSNFTALTCKSVSLIDNRDITLLQAPVISLTTSTPEWLFWFLVPTSAPLDIEHATIHLSQIEELSLSPPTFPISLSIKTLYVVYDDETTEVFQNFSGELQELLRKISAKKSNNSTSSEEIKNPIT